MNEQNPVLSFPCHFPIKAMGRDEEGFDELVVEIICRHADEPAIQDVRRRASRGGNFLSVTVTVAAQSRDQLDNIYRDLTGHPRVLMVL